MRVLIAIERPDRLADVAAIVTSLGHEVIAREMEVAESATRRHASGPTSHSSGYESSTSRREARELRTSRALR